jgi:hypothetical protein
MGWVGMGWVGRPVSEQDKGIVIRWSRAKEGQRVTGVPGGFLATNSMAADGKVQRVIIQRGMPGRRSFSEPV